MASDLFFVEAAALFLVGGLPECIAGRAVEALLLMRLPFNSYVLIGLLSLFAFSLYILALRSRNSPMSIVKDPRSLPANLNIL